MKDGISSTKLTQSQLSLESTSSNSLSISQLIPPERTLSTCFGVALHWNAGSELRFAGNLQGTLGIFS